jgi:hypothetical protein
MKTLNRLLLIALSLALLGATYAMHTGMTHLSIGHDNYYTLKWPCLSEVREVAIYGLLGWCALFVKREPTLVRVGLIAVILAFVIMALPTKLGDPAALLKSAWH